ncbi:radical SAM protein [Nocardia sp. NPDC058058]|uniref:radical SAM protein n=1 Tax=Nocardia sp. NPDC058058 TaxID=3346317 RepID=UPI0036D78E3E
MTATEIRFPGVDIDERIGEGAELVTHRIGDREHTFSLPLTFTPFASAQPCSARCVFCSETLRHRDATVLSAGLRPGPDYFDGLARSLRELRGLPFGLSLSGLESTDDPDWLERVLALIDAHEGPITEKVLYTNTAGLSRETHGARLIPRLREFGLTRAEVSRHHPDQQVNDRIMRFRKGKPVADNAVFERTVRDVVAAMPVRLVCIVQASGIHDLAGVEHYLAWARELGVTDVVFREFSRLADLYRPNAPLRLIEQDRVPIETLLDQVWPAATEPAAGFAPLRHTVGYYYWNLRLRWRDAVDVTFETSDYGLMKERHHSGVVYKLIHHANGNLCADWDPQTDVLLRTA